MDKADREDLTRRMEGALAKLKSEFASLRAGRASPAMLDRAQAEAYGQMMPIEQLGTIQVPEPRLISVQVWDKGLVGAVEKAIRDADLGLNPVVEGQMVRIPIPPLNEERRQEMAKSAGKYAEAARVAVRNVRRDGMEKIRAREKDGEMGKDEAHAAVNEIQALTDRVIGEIGELLGAKEKEILQP